jgi:glutathione S-transferase
MAFTLYARNNSSNCQKVIWLFAELGVPLAIVPAGLQNALNKSNPEYLKLNATGLVPLLKHTVDGADVLIDESNTILRYVVDVTQGIAGEARRIGGLATPQSRARVSRWQDYTHSIEAAMKPVYFHTIRGVKLDETALTSAKKTANDTWAIVDTQLDHREYLAGDFFSLAEITLGAQLHRYFSLDFSPRPQLPRLAALYERLKQRPLFVEHVVNIPFV